MVYYFAFDVETTGLNHDKEGNFTTNNLLSIAYVLLDENLSYLEHGQYIIGASAETLFLMDPYVFEMHCSTGLVQNIQRGNVKGIKYVENQILGSLNQFITNEDVLIPVGNNVQFDVEVIRRTMPTLYSKMKYSYLDVSSIRKALGLYNKEIPGLVHKFKKSNHDSMIDTQECIKELRLYLKLFEYFNIEDVEDEIKLMEE